MVRVGWQNCCQGLKAAASTSKIFIQDRITLGKTSTGADWICHVSLNNTEPRAGPDLRKCGNNRLV